MHNDIKKRWVEALRSGEYEQGEKKLRTDEDKFCCLGVLCDLAVKDGLGEWLRYSPISGIDSVHWYFGTSAAVLPEDVAEWAGLNDRADYDDPEVEAPQLLHETYGIDVERTTLATLNDNHVPFADIAAIIEEQL